LSGKGNGHGLLAILNPFREKGKTPRRVPKGCIKNIKGGGKLSWIFTRKTSPRSKKEIAVIVPIRGKKLGGLLAKYACQ